MCFVFKDSPRVACYSSFMKIHNKALGANDWPLCGWFALILNSKMHKGRVYSIQAYYKMGLQ